MNKKWTAAIGAAVMVAFAAPVAHADSISGVEGARAKERQGRYLSRQDREELHRYGGNDDYYRGRYRDYGYRDYDDYDGGSGVGVYVGRGGVGVYGN